MQRFLGLSESLFLYPLIRMISISFYLQTGELNDLLEHAQQAELLDVLQYGLLVFLSYLFIVVLEN